MFARSRPQSPSLNHCRASSTNYNAGGSERASWKCNADVVIIGGGIVGASIAWHLTEAGCRNVLIVERESHQGKGSTGKSMGGVRAQFATKPNIQMSLYSIPFYAALKSGSVSLRITAPQGYMFVATKPAHLDISADQSRCRSRSG